jgi:hypothetical protein
VSATNSATETHRLRRPRPSARFLPGDRNVLAMHRQFFDEAMAIRATTPKLGAMKFKPIAGRFPPLLVAEIVGA